MDRLTEQDLHEHYMRLALKQAAAAMEEGEVPTGCVIVGPPDSEDKPRRPLLGKAHNQVETLRDPTAHAEMIAITQAAAARGDWRLTDTTLYVTKEPCAMCAGAIVLARVRMVVFGAADPVRGGAVSAFNILNHEKLNHRCKVVGGVLANECADILKTFFAQRR